MWCVVLHYQHLRSAVLPSYSLSSAKHRQAMQVTVVFACLCLAVSAAATAQSDFRVACYMDASTQRLFHHISPSICTHVISSSAYLADDLSFKTTSQDEETGCMSLRALRERSPSLKTLLGVEIKQSRLELVTQNQASLDTFTDSTLKYLKEKNYDGLELTWMDNSASDETPRTKETLASFVKNLRGRLEEDTNLSNKSVLISVTILDRSDHDSTRNDEETLSQYVDFIALFPPSLRDEDVQIDSTIKSWQDKGVDPKKVILALPAFLRRSRRREHWRQSPESVAVIPGKVEQSYGPGLMMAKQVCQAIKSGQTELKTLTKLESAQSLREEVSWLLQKGIGGAGVVMLDVDAFTDFLCLNCTENEKAILESKVISGSPHHHHHHDHHHHHRLRGHGGHSRRGHYHHGHHHHHDTDGRAPHSSVQTSQDDQSFDGNDTGHRHGHHRHGHRHGYGHHGHSRRGHDHYGRGRQGHGPHHGEAHSHHDHHSSA